MKNRFLLLILLVLSFSCKKSEAVGQDKAMSVNEGGLAIPPPPKVDQVKFVKPVVANSEESILVEK